MDKEIAFFDFDGTITKKDTLLEFLKFQFGFLSVLFFIVRCLPQIISFTVGIINNHRFKEVVLTYYVGETSVENFQEYCRLFNQKRMNNLIRPAALEEIKTLQERDVKVVIVSASPENWIVLWASQYNIEVIATKLENKNNKLTGKIDGLNCSGFEKVRRVKEAYNLAEFKKIHCYGNSKHDLEMLSIAHKAHMKPFRTKSLNKTILSPK